VVEDFYHGEICISVYPAIKDKDINYVVKKYLISLKRFRLGMNRS